MTLLLGIILFLFFILVGIIFLSIIGIEKKYLTNANFLLITPILGALTMVCFGEFLIFIFSMKYTSWLFLIILSIIGYINRKKVFIALEVFYKKMKGYLLLSLLAGIIVSIPSLKIFSLNSPRIINNDIAFYLSSMDWLLHNSFRNFKSLLSINPNVPYYSLATYMIRETRTGTEFLGSQIMGLLFLEPHQVYYSLGIAISCILPMTSAFFLRYVLGIKKKTVLFYMLICSSSLLIFELQRMQYTPQLFGISGMILFLGIMIDFVKNKQIKKEKFLLGFSLAGVLSIYAEFGTILFTYFFITCSVIFLGNKNKKESLKKIYELILGCLLSFPISPLGMFKAVKFNLVVLTQVFQKVSNIDPFEGTMISPSLYIPNILGFLIRSKTIYNIKISAKDFNTWERVVLGLSICYLLIGICVVFFILFKRINKLNIIFILILLFFISYGYYFRKVNFAYGEYKFLLGIIPVAFMIITYFIQHFFDFLKNEKIKNVLEIIAVELIILFVILNLSNTLFLSRQKYFFYDKSLMELRKVGEKLPKGSIVDIPGTGNDVHAGVYALKNNKVRIKGFSYYTDFLNPEKLAITGRSYYTGTLEQMKNIPMKDSDYYLEIKDNDSDALDIIKENKKIYWENRKYRLVQKSSKIDNISLKIGKGFDIVEIEGKTGIPFRWITNKEAEISLKNHSNNNITIQLVIEIKGIKNIHKSIDIFMNNQLIGSGKSPNQVKTKYFILKPNKNYKILLKMKDPLTSVKNDTRNFGVQVRGIKINVK